ncbi:hypothetical protein BSNK01_03760 [Bacillaceae bacterium]
MFGKDKLSALLFCGGVAALLPLALGFWSLPYRWAFFLFGLLCLGGGWRRSARRWEREKAAWSQGMERVEQEYQRQLAECLKQYRHDVSNHLQVLLAYLKMGRNESAQKYIAMIREQAKRESALSQLGYLPLVAYFLTFNLLHKELRLQVDWQEPLDLAALPVNEETVYRRVTQIVELYRRHAVHLNGEQNSLHLHMHWDGAKLRLSFAFEGEMDHESFRRAIAPLAGEIKNEEKTFAEGLHCRHTSVIEVLPTAS